MSEERLGRIEKKLDDLAQAVVGLARMEERMITLFKRMDTYDNAQFKLSERVNELEKSSTKKTAILSVGERLVWLVVGAIVVTFVNLMTPPGM